MYRTSIGPVVYNPATRAFEALVTLLIIFGDSLGGFLYVVSITLEIFFMVWPRFVSKTLANWNFQQL